LLIFIFTPVVNKYHRIKKNAITSFLHTPLEEGNLWKTLMFKFNTQSKSFFYTKADMNCNISFFFRFANSPKGARGKICTITFTANK